MPTGIGATLSNPSGLRPLAVVNLSLTPGKGTPLFLAIINVKRQRQMTNPTISPRQALESYLDLLEKQQSDEETAIRTDLALLKKKLDLIFYLQAGQFALFEIVTLSTADIAQLTGRSRATISRWYHNGLEAIDRRQHHKRASLGAVLRYLQKERQNLQVDIAYMAALVGVR